ncbi:DNA polymerase III subunit delta' [Ciceribacter sp. L1K22]|uniref:DNA polymerase III subunit delta' n=1 Tax=Ciceribacter sp. L1K22 TaxID=2820275 RepID=UPI001ABDF205|nr:DNA polymerase III subunit delta' [Ciceribacter sp. L1K22]MBO3760331.1 DNA polymerase III subunit delta' [Ciceribacter sp. L1K22]
MTDNAPGVLEGAIAPSVNTALYGHQEAQDFLAQSYRSGKGHHALLIEGPEGIGKATLAFRFANHVLSHPDPSTAPERLAAPDAASAVSRQIASGASHNLLHLTRPVDEKTGKAKSAITVDEVRKAGHFFSQTSGSGNWRIVIIDPADDLNRNAANAILKILEEPPKRALFLVLSHAPGKLLPTIRSRCQPLRLSPLGDGELTAALKHLGYAFRSDEEAHKVLSLAAGSVSRALKIINYGGLDIIAAFDKVVSQTGPSQRKAMHQIADALSGRDNEAAFDFFVEHILDHAADAARAAARAGDLATAERHARLTSTIAERFRVSAAYNLDRKQTILDAFGDLFG